MVRSVNGVNVIGPHRPARNRPIRRYVVLGLLLLAVAAPAGFVVAGETRRPYLAMLTDGAATSLVPDLTGAPGAALPFRIQALPEAMRSPVDFAAGPSEQVVDGAKVARALRSISARHRVNFDSTYASAMGGFSARLTAAQRRALEADPAVAMVVPDFEVGLEDLAGLEAGGIRTTANPGVRVPAGIRRVGARQKTVTAQASRARANADVAIIDTGVQRDHPDLNVVGGYNCTSRNRDRWDDTHGHGTHVAGIVGALDNRIGVVGVAPGVRLWSVKVLGSNGRGFMSWIVCGIDWVTAQRQDGRRSRPMIEVANMSISFTLPGSQDRDCGELNRDSIHAAICRSVAGGTTYVVAAGNNSRNARRNRPGAYDEVITVSAMADFDGRGGGRGRGSCPYGVPERDDAFASFSNYGSDVDLIAPGRCVLSTYLRGRYAWMSGTSMAAPHVAGAAAIYRALYPRAKPQQVRLALRAVGTHDWRTQTDPDDAHEPAVWIGSFRAIPDFSVSTKRRRSTVAAGQEASVNVAVRRSGGFDEPVAISLESAPRGVKAAPFVVTEGGGSLLIDVSRWMLPGTYELELRAGSGDMVRTTRLQLHVAAPAGD